MGHCCWKFLPMPKVKPCDQCWRPGHCCTGFVLSTNTRGMTCFEILARFSTIKVADSEGNPDFSPIPFQPFFIDSKGDWRYWCPNLGLDGRCQDYAHRPVPCRGYEPLSDQLCFMHDREAGDPTVPTND